MSTPAIQPDEDSAADCRAAALAELEACSDVVQFKIDDVERRLHPPHRPTCADLSTDDTAFALDGSLPTEAEIRRAERLHEQVSIDPIAETRDRVDAKDGSNCPITRDQPGHGRSKTQEPRHPVNGRG